MYEAIIALKDSLNGDSSTFCPPDLERDQFLRGERDSLKSLIVDPEWTTAKTTDWVREHGHFHKTEYRMLIVAGENESWLLYDPSTKQFSLANGQRGSDLILVGYRSEDALAEWRG